MQTNTHVGQRQKISKNINGAQYIEYCAPLLAFCRFKPYRTFVHLQVGSADGQSAQ
jgi:hypothetical protein